MGKTKRHLAQVAIATAMTAGGIVAVTAPPASAAAVTCTISSITPIISEYHINFNCRKGTVNPPDHAYGVEIWGEDTFSDDHRATNYLNGMNIGSSTPTQVTGSILNEDYGDKDDIYVKVKFRNVSTGATYKVRSNTIHGWWS